MYRTVRIITLTAIFLLVGNVSMAEQQSDGSLEQLQKEVFALKQGQAIMRNDLAEIKRLLREAPRAAPSGAAAFRPADLTVGNSAILGDEDATVTVFGFSNYECPFCGRHATTVFPEIVKNYVETGKVRIIMRENPIQSIHPKAMAAANAALCAGEQGEYWEMHDLIFSDSKKIGVPDLKAHAISLELDEGPFNACLDSQKFANQIRNDLAEASRLGISGTPSFVIGLTNKQDSNKVRVTKYLRGAKSYADFQVAIEDLLASAN